MTKEQWRPVVGWEGMYEVSDMGRIRSFDRETGARNGGSALRRGRVMVQVPKQGRYLAVTFADKDRREQHTVHTVVARAFLGEIPEGKWVLHRDDDKANNVLSNIYYGTPQQNSDDRTANGNHTKGERHPMVKLTEQQVRAIRNNPADAKTLANIYGVHSGTIHAIRSRRAWRHI